MMYAMHLDTSPCQSLLDCLSDLKLWMANNFFNFNDHKTEAILCGPHRSIVSPDADFGVLASHLKSSILNLGVNFDSALTFDGHVNGVVKSAFDQMPIKGQAFC